MTSSISASGVALLTDLANAVRPRSDTSMVPIAVPDKPAAAIATVHRQRMALAALGYWTIPVATGGKKPSNNGWPERRGCPSDAVARPNGGSLNTGIDCRGLRAIDIDVDDPDVARDIEILVMTKLGALAAVPVRFRENSARKLVLYRAAEGEPGKRVTPAGTLKNEDGKAAKVEVLGRGQQFVALGVHDTGAPLRWFADWEVPASLVAELPALNDLLPVTEDAITALLLDLAVLLGADPNAVVIPKATAAPLSSARQLLDLDDETLEAIAELIGRTPNTVAGQGDYLLWGRAIAATFHRRPDLGREVWLAWCSRWDGVQAPGRPEADWNRVTAEENRQTVHALLSKVQAAGVAIPAAVRDGVRSAEVAAQFGGDLLPGSAWSGGEGAGPAHDEDRFPALEDAVRASEDALALRFAEQHVGQFTHIADFGGWHKWVGHKFEGGAKPAAFDLARAVCRGEAWFFQQEDARLGRKISSNSTVAAVTSLAASDPRLSRRAAEFDRDEWAINTPGGVVDLQTGRLRPHRLAEPFLKSASVAPGGGCPRWLSFLGEITQGDAEVVAYLRRWAGYMLTGSVREEAFLFLYGPGGNGKSVFLDILSSLMGDYATPAMESVFLQARNEAHPTEKAALRGARLVTVAEVEEGRFWAESRLKDLTGGTVVSARVSRGDPFEFQPMFKLVICGNHKPKLRNPDKAMRRRTHLLPLEFTPAKPDPKLKVALKAELGGIFQWAIGCCLAWQREGLDAPKLVRDAVSEYFREADLLGCWVDDRCERDPEAWTGSSALYADFVEFARGRRENPRSAAWFGPEMEKLFTKKDRNTGRGFKGVKLKPYANAVFLAE